MRRNAEPWYRDPKKFSVALGIALTVAGVFLWWSQRPSPVPVPPPVPPTSPASLVSTSQVWGADGCIHTQVTLVKVVLSDTPKDLCRSAVTDNGETDYYLFPRGGSSAQSLEETASLADGYNYFLYPSLAWLRQSRGGGPVQIKLTYTDGTTGYEDLSTWSSGVAALQSQLFYLSLDKAEAAVNSLLNQANEAPLNQSQLNSGQLSAANAEIARQKAEIVKQQQQLAQAQQQLNQQSGAQTVANEEQFLQQEASREWQITTAPPCYFSYNGCGP